MRTSKGNIKTTPNGTEIFELCLNRMRLRKNAIRGSQSLRGAVSPKVASFSSEVSFFADGIRFTTLLTKSMMATETRDPGYRDRGTEDSTAGPE